MLLGVINESSGSFAWFDAEDFENCRKKIGSILEHPIFYPELTGYANLEISARIKGCDLSRIDIVLERVGLIGRKDSKFKTYSLGMKQRLALAGALLSDPEVLVLDEPTNGLDPQGINKMRELILSIAAEGKTIIISSHLLDEIQKMCTHMAILKNGNLIKTGSINEILSEGHQFEVKANVNTDDFEKAITQLEYVSSIKKEDDLLLVTCESQITTEKLNQDMFSAGIVLTHLAEHKASLEVEFLNLVQ
jgi:ABC-2 type transport system ATP-binding protein